MREMDEAGDMMMHGDANAVSVQPGENEQLMWVHHTPGRWRSAWSWPIGHDHAGRAASTRSATNSGDDQVSLTLTDARFVDAYVEDHAFTVDGQYGPGEVVGEAPEPAATSSGEDGRPRGVNVRRSWRPDPGKAASRNDFRATAARAGPRRSRCSTRSRHRGEPATGGTRRVQSGHGR